MTPAVPMQPDLVIRAANGDREAFSQLANTAFDQLYRTARLILRDEDRAADAVQEALLSAWVHIHAVRDPDRFEAWLRRLLVHACYREAGRVGRRRDMEVQITELDMPGTEDVQRATANRDQIERGFRRLSIDQRAALTVHHYLGLTDLDAAVVLDIPLGTYKSRLNRATSALRLGARSRWPCPGAPAGVGRMTRPDIFDAELGAWLDDEAQPPVPAAARDRALAAIATRRTRPGRLARLGSHWVGQPPRVAPPFGTQRLALPVLGSTSSILLLAMLLALVGRRCSSGAAC